MSVLILITDSIPSANGAGISQTLFNLFKQWEGAFRIITRDTEIVPVEKLTTDILHWRFEKYKLIQNRFGKWANGTIVKRNFEWQQKNSTSIHGLPLASDSLILVSTTEPIKLHLAWCLLQQGYTIVPYFMDDWLAGNQLKWKGGSIQQVANDILQAAPCWLMISRQLEETLRKRYGLQKKPCLVVHNPAPDLISSYSDRKQIHTLNQKPACLDSISGRSEIRNHQIIYAGSIWPMHADALIATAKAVHLLHEKPIGDSSFDKLRMTASFKRSLNDKTLCQAELRRSPVDAFQQNFVPELLIYTGESHWKKYRGQLEGPGIRYAGWKPYNEIHSILSNAWLLLCTASFDDKHKAFSDSSVQTKLTDYMAVGKPVLFVGPAGAASGVFVEEQEIGFTIEIHEPKDIAARLEAISRMHTAWDRKANNGQELARTSFSKKVVQEKLYRFLDQYAQPNDMAHHKIKAEH